MIIIAHGNVVSRVPPCLYSHHTQCTKGSQLSLDRFSGVFWHLVEKLCGRNRTAFVLDKQIRVAAMLHFVKLGPKPK